MRRPAAWPGCAAPSIRRRPAAGIAQRPCGHAPVTSDAGVRRGLRDVTVPSPPTARCALQQREAHAATRTAVGAAGAGAGGASRAGRPSPHKASVAKHALSIGCMQASFRMLLGTALTFANYAEGAVDRLHFHCSTSHTVRRPPRVFTSSTRSRPVRSRPGGSSSHGHAPCAHATHGRRSRPVPRGSRPVAAPKILLRQLGPPLQGVWALNSSELPGAVPDGPT
jgi:hypothetical protein